MDAGSDRSVCWRCLSDLLMDTVHTEIFDVEKPFFCLCSSLFFSICWESRSLGTLEFFVVEFLTILYISWTILVLYFFNFCAQLTIKILAPQH
jgi:Ca2+/Na+ antiporter